MQWVFLSVIPIFLEILQLKRPPFALWSPFYLHLPSERPIHVFLIPDRQVFAIESLLCIYPEAAAHDPMAAMDF